MYVKMKGIEMKDNRCVSVVKVYIDTIISPINDWNKFNIIFNNLQSELVKASTKVISLCNIYASILLNDGKEKADQWVFDTYNMKNLVSAMYHPVRFECINFQANITAAFSREIHQKYFSGKNSYLNAIKNGTGNPPMTFTDKLPIPLVKRSSKIKRSEGKTERYFDITFSLLSKEGVKNMSKIIYGDNSDEKCCGQLKFQTNAKDDNTYRVLENIVNGNYDLCGSKLTRVKKKRTTATDKTSGRRYDYILILSYNHPVKEKYLDPEKVMGVDLGIQIPAMCAVNFNDKYRRSLGGNKIIKENMRQQHINKVKQKEITYNCRDGHGRKAKLDGWDGQGHKINNRNATYNHMLSKQIVDQAIKWGCGTINIEDLSGITSTANKFLKSWTYFDLQSKIEYKAAQNNIEVRKINPYHTSQICSVCGYTIKDNRPKGEKGQAYFKCCKCGFETNADFNAARNIAMSTDFSKAKKIKPKKKSA